MSGTLIVLEGTDGSGKSTQKKLLTAALKAKGYDFREVTFPRYEEESSALVRMYLGGKFGSSPDAVPAEAASVFYTVDRYASYKIDWGPYYDQGGIVICDRYTTANAVHQTPKLDKDKWWQFTDWLFDFEYKTMALPKPDLVLFLDMPTDIALQLIDKRQGSGGDIHELNHEYLKKCRECAVEIAAKYGWKRIVCGKDGQAYAQQAIHEQIMEKVEMQLR